VVSGLREVDAIARPGGDEFARPVPAAEFEALAAQTRRVTLR
jgi:GGDEF domain-containing protein